MKALDGVTFAKAWKAVSIATADNDARPLLCGVEVSEYPDGVMLAATDSFLLLWAWVPYDPTTPMPPLSDKAHTSWVVRDADNLADALLSGILGRGVSTLDTVTPVIGEDRDFLLRSGIGDVRLLRIEATYPDWRSVALGAKNTRTAAVCLAPKQLARLGRLTEFLGDPAALEMRPSGQHGVIGFTARGSVLAVAGAVMPMRVPGVGAEHSRPRNW